MVSLASIRLLTRRSFHQPLLSVAVLALFIAAPDSPQNDAHLSFNAIQRQVEAIEPSLIKSTVMIRLFDGSGSGVIVSPDGLVLTAGHVVEGREGRRVGVMLADGRQMRGIVLGSDRDSDMGIVKIDDASNLPSSPIGDSNTIHRGEWVLATGHPLGPHAGRPPVLRIGRVLSGGGRRMMRDSRSINTDAPIISGDSGGPLFDLSGHVIGINSMVTSGARPMMSIHMPINLAKAAVEEARRGERPDLWSGPPSSFVKAYGGAVTALDSGDPTTTVRLAREAEGADSTSASAKLLLARAYAQLGQKPLALSALIGAVDHGFNDVEVLRRDSDLSPLLSDPTFARTLKQLEDFSGIPGEKKGDHAILASASLPGIARGVVKIQSGNNVVALGTIMSSNGDILTKASELPDGLLKCILPDGRTLVADRGGVDAAWDIALLRVSVPDLQAVSLADQPMVGEWTINPDSSQTPAAVGIVSVADMPVYGKGIAAKPTSKAYMGVRMVPIPMDDLNALGLSHGVMVVVEKDYAAAAAGIISRDILLEADGQNITDPDTLMDLLVKKKPGDSVVLHVAREKARMTIKVTLGTRPADIPGRGGIPEMLSGDVSHMQGPFTRVLQHDSVLSPQNMGGPLLDLSGKCIGLNIARADRTSTYAIEVRDLKEIYARLKADNTGHVQTAAR